MADSNQDYKKFILKEVTQTSSASSSSSQFQEQVTKDISNLIFQWNEVFYPSFAGGANSPSVPSPTSGDPPGDGRLDVIEHGLYAGTLITDIYTTKYGPPCFWASNRAEPASVLETFLCILEEIAALENAISQIEVDATTDEFDDTCIKAELEHIANLISCDYTFDCDSTVAVKYGIYQSLQALDQVIDGFPDFGLDHSCYDTFPTLSLTVLLSKVTLDIQYELSNVESSSGASGTTILDDLNCIYDFIGSSGLSECAPTYSDHGSGALVTVTDGDSLEEAIYDLDQRQAADGDWYAIETNASTGVETYTGVDTTPSHGAGIFHKGGVVGVGVDPEAYHMHGEMGTVGRNFGLLVRSNHSEYVADSTADEYEVVHSGMLLWTDVKSYHYGGSSVANKDEWIEPGSASAGAEVLSEIAFSAQDSKTYTGTSQWTLEHYPSIKGVFRGATPSTYNGTDDMGGDLSFYVGGQFNSIRTNTAWAQEEVFRVSHNIGCIVDPGLLENDPQHRLHAHTSSKTHYDNSVDEALRTTIGLTHVNAHTTSAAPTITTWKQGLVLGVNGAGRGSVTLFNGTDYDGADLTNQLHFGVVDETRSHLAIYEDTAQTGWGRVGIHYNTGIAGGAVRTLHVQGPSDTPPVRIQELQTGGGQNVVIDTNGDLWLGPNSAVPNQNNSSETDNIQEGYTHNWKTGAANNRQQTMHLSETGNLGIGTSTPGMKLHVIGGDETTAKFEDSTGKSMLVDGNSLKCSHHLHFNVGSGKSIYFQDGGTNNGIIDGSGNLGIGTITPDMKLHVIGGDETTAKFEDSTGKSMLVDGNSLKCSHHLHFNVGAGKSIYFQDGSNTNAVIDGSGNVGIGTTTPGATLDVDGSCRIGNDGTTADGTIQYASNDFLGRKNGSWVSLTSGGSSTDDLNDLTDVNYVTGGGSPAEGELFTYNATADVWRNQTLAEAGVAPAGSPNLTGTPTVPTAGTGTNTTQIASTAFVQTEIAATIDGAPGALNTLNELAAALGDDANYATTTTNAIALKAPIADPTFTGEIGIGSVNVSETELGILEGATVTTAELNILDGVTATTAEVNFLDGVTSAIQTQLDSKGATAGSGSITTVGTITSGTWEGTDIGVTHGGTGVSTLTDGGILLGSGAGAITAMAVLANGEMIVGDGSTDPVAESGATLRTSIGVGTGDSPQFTDCTLSGGDLNFGATASTINVAAVSGSNVAGNDLTIKAGQSTGSGEGGAIIFQVAPGLGSGTGVNALTDAVTISDTGTTTFQQDIDAEYTAFVIANQTNSNDVNGFVAFRADLGNTDNATMIQSAMIAIKKEGAFTSNASTQDGKMEFHTVLNGTLTNGMTLTSDNNLDVNGVVTATGFTIGSAVVTEAELEVLDGITATTAELNILDGVTASAPELNILDGVTADAGELNKLDGLTASTAELNYINGVSSSIQTQLNLKATIASPAFTGSPTAPTQSGGDNSTKIATTAYADAAGGAGGITASSTDTLTNKTIDADGTGNAISNIDNANIKAGADIAFGKMENLTASRALTSNGSGDVEVSLVTTTELGYLDGVTSGIQTQLDGKVSTSATTETLTINSNSDIVVDHNKKDMLLLITRSSGNDGKILFAEGSFVADDMFEFKILNQSEAVTIEVDVATSYINGVADASLNMPAGKAHRVLIQDGAASGTLDFILL